MPENPYEPPQTELGPLPSDLNMAPDEPRHTTPPPPAMSPLVATVSAVIIAVAALPAIFLGARGLHALGIDMGSEITDFDQAIPLALLMVAVAVAVISLRIKSYRRKS